MFLWSVSFILQIAKTETQRNWFSRSVVCPWASDILTLDGKTPSSASLSTTSSLLAQLTQLRICMPKSAVGILSQVHCKGLPGSRGGFRKEGMWPEYLNKRPGWGQVLSIGLRRSCWGHGLVTFPRPSWWPLGTRGAPTHWWHCSLVLHCESTLLICTY